MGIRSLLSFGLIAVPIGATLGILLGLDQHRKATGQTPLFQDNSVTTKQYCQKAYGISPTSNGQQYTLNPNQWGWNEGDPGSLCMNVTSFGNYTYATNITAPQFSVTWEYPQGPPTQPVHAFPNIALESDATFPIAISNLQHLYVDVHWSYGLGNTSATTTDVAALTAANVNTNVAIDMFADSSETKSQSTTESTYEVMVWFAMIGPSTQPIGWADGTKGTQVINGSTFNLYYGTNGNNQEVLTWVASTPTTDFTGDIAPLVTSLSTMGIANAPASSNYLGYMGLGSETLWTPQFVTFNVSSLSMQAV